MGLINAGTFISVVNNYRLLWIAGRFGGGKTSLAFMMAQEWLKKGYRLVTNGRCIWSDKLDDLEFVDEFGHLKLIVVLDEGGLEFKGTRQVEAIASYAAKMDVIYILPSFWPPVRSAQVVIAQPLFGFTRIGVPLIIYKWRVKLGGFDDGGYFGWWLPSEIYGVYSRQDPGDLAEDIIDFLVEKAEKFRGLYGRKNRLRQVEVSSEDLIADAASTFAGAIDDASESLSISKRKRRGGWR